MVSPTTTARWSCPSAEATPRRPTTTATSWKWEAVQVGGFYSSSTGDAEQQFHAAGFQQREEQRIKAESTFVNFVQIALRGREERQSCWRKLSFNYCKIVFARLGLDFLVIKPILLLTDAWLPGWAFLGFWVETICRRESLKWLRQFSNWIFYEVSFFRDQKEFVAHRHFRSQGRHNFYSCDAVFGTFNRFSRPNF